MAVIDVTDWYLFDTSFVFKPERHSILRSSDIPNNKCVSFGCLLNVHLDTNGE